MDPLPPGFEFRHYIDGPGLYLGDQAVAFASPANHDPDPPWRLCLNVGSLRARTHFVATEEGARRYMAAWARKWEAEIRAAQRATASPFGHLARSGRPMPEGRHPRPRSRRGVKLV